MQRAWAFFLIFTLSFAATAQFRLYAQDTTDSQEEAAEDENRDEQPTLETDWDAYMPDLYSKGDKTFSMSLGAMFPTVFTQNGKQPDNINLYPAGGLFSLGITYFFDSHFFLGGEVGGMFISTTAKHTLYLVPMGLKGGYQFVIGKFEIPLNLMIGGAPTKYLELGYFGFCMRGGVSLFYRFFPTWSFGINTNWNWFPQEPMEDNKRVPAKNADGHIIDVTLSARYHF